MLSKTDIWQWKEEKNIPGRCEGVRHDEDAGSFVLMAAHQELELQLVRTHGDCIRPEHPSEDRDKRHAKPHPMISMPSKQSLWGKFLLFILSENTNMTDLGERHSVDGPPPLLLQFPSSLFGKHPATLTDPLLPARDAAQNISAHQQNPKGTRKVRRHTGLVSGGSVVNLRQEPNESLVLRHCMIAEIDPI